MWPTPTLSSEHSLQTIAMLVTGGLIAASVLSRGSHAGDADALDAACGAVEKALESKRVAEQDYDPAVRVGNLSLATGYLSVARQLAPDGELERRTSTQVRKLARKIEAARAQALGELGRGGSQSGDEKISPPPAAGAKDAPPRAAAARKAWM